MHLIRLIVFFIFFTFYSQTASARWQIQGPSLDGSCSISTESDEGLTFVLSIGDGYYNPTIALFQNLALGSIEKFTNVPVSDVIILIDGILFTTNGFYLEVPTNDFGTSSIALLLHISRNEVDAFIPLFSRGHQLAITFRGTSLVSLSGSAVALTWMLECANIEELQR